MRRWGREIRDPGGLEIAEAVGFLVFGLGMVGYLGGGSIS